jgi:hypothetical protein
MPLPEPPKIPSITLQAARQALAEALGVASAPGAARVVEAPPSVEVADTWLRLSNLALRSSGELKAAGLAHVSEEVMAAGLHLRYAARLHELDEDEVTDGTVHLAAVEVYAAVLHLQYATSLHPTWFNTADRLDAVGAAA